MEWKSQAIGSQGWRLIVSVGGDNYYYTMFTIYRDKVQLDSSTTMWGACCPILVYLAQITP